MLRNLSIRLYLIAFSLFVPMISLSSPSLEDYGALRNVQMMRISPDGKHIAYRRVDEKKDALYVVSLVDKKVVTATDISAVAPEFIYFLNNHKVVIGAGEYRRIPGYRGTHTLSSAYAVDIKSGEFAQLLTPGDNIYLGQTGLGDIIGVSSDQKYVFMPAFVGKDRHDPTPHRSVMRVELDSPRHPKEFFKGSDNSRDFFLSRKGQVIAHEEYNQRSNEHSIEVRKGKKWVKIYSEKVDVPYLGFQGLSSDEKSLVVLTEDEKTGRDNYFLMPLESGKLQDAGYGRADADIESVYFDRNKKVLGLQFSGLIPEYRFFDERLESLMASAKNYFPDQAIYLNSWTEDRSKLVVMVSGYGFPDDYYLIESKKTPIFLATGRPNIKTDDVHPLGRVTIKARDGLKIPTILTIPKQNVSAMKNLPTVMLPHGGPASYDEARFDFIAQAFANQGYLVVQPQFRGSSGFGSEHELAGWGQWGKAMQDDLTDTLDFMVKKGMSDPGRVCIVGASYGGYAALAGGAFTPDLYRCVVSIAGVSDLNTMLKMEKRDHGRDHWVISYWEKAMADGDARKDFLKSVSPVHFAENFNAPVLLLHGDRDKVVDIKQSKLMEKALKKAGKSVELIKLSSENHHLLKSETRLLALTEAVKFVDKHLRKE